MISTPEGNMTYFVSRDGGRAERLRVNWKEIKINISPNEQIMRKCQVLFSGFYLSRKKAKNAAFYSFDAPTKPLKQTRTSSRAVITRTS